MKKLIISFLVLIFAFFACTKERVEIPPTAENNILVNKGKTVDYTNPDPTWIQVVEPILLAAKWSAYWVPLGFTAGVPAPSTSYGAMVVVPDTVFTVKWHLHVGLRNFNTTLKPDVIDKRYITVNAVNQQIKSIPNGGVMGDYDFVDTVRITRNGYNNDYFWPYGMGLGYNWNGISPEVHSSATNGFIYDVFNAGVKITN